MKTASRKIRAIAAALGALLILSTLAVAANAVDIARKCSLTVKVGDASLTAEEAGSLDITANLYKVADFSGTDYTYTALAGFDAGLAGYRDFTDAQLTEAAAAAKSVIDGMDEDVSPATVTFTANGSGTLADLDCGLYLLVTTAADKTQTYDYTFNPVLLSLPSMDANGSDNYDVKGLELKFERETAKASLVITKQLPVYSEKNGPATFVFQVDAVKGGETVYSNVVSLVFDAAGTRTVTVAGLPSGSDVTVTEVYSGAGYTVRGEGVQVIENLLPTPAGEDVPSVEFINDYNGGRQSGHSITNHFTAGTDGSWELTPYPDSAPEVQ